MESQPQPPCFNKAEKVAITNVGAPEYARDEADADEEEEDAHEYNNKADDVELNTAARAATEVESGGWAPLWGTGGSTIWSSPQRTTSRLSTWLPLAVQDGGEARSQQSPPLSADGDAGANDSDDVDNSNAQSTWSVEDLADADHIHRRCDAMLALCRMCGETTHSSKECRRFRTDMCAGGCATSRGARSRCTFAHSPQELRTPPHFKTKMCTAAAATHDGVCMRAFAHSHRELTMARMALLAQQCAMRALL